VKGRNFQAGQQVPIKVKIRNEGELPLPPVAVNLTVDGISYADWMLPHELGPGDSIVWSPPYTGVRGMHLLVATVDPLNDVPEAERSRSSSFLNLPVGEARSLLSSWALLGGFASFLVGAAAGILLRRPQPVRRTAGPRRPKGRARRPPARPPTAPRSR